MLISWPINASSSLFCGVPKYGSNLTDGALSDLCLVFVMGRMCCLTCLSVPPSNARWIIIPFAMWVVPFPQRVSSPKSMLSQTIVVKLLETVDMNSRYKAVSFSKVVLCEVLCPQTIENLDELWWTCHMSDCHWKCMEFRGSYSVFCLDIHDILCNRQYLCSLHYLSLIHSHLHLYLHLLLLSRQYNWIVRVAQIALYNWHWGLLRSEAMGFGKLMANLQFHFSLFVMKSNLFPYCLCHLNMGCAWRNIDLFCFTILVILICRHLFKSTIDQIRCVNRSRIDNISLLGGENKLLLGKTFL